MSTAFHILSPHYRKLASDRLDSYHSYLVLIREKIVERFGSVDIPTALSEAIQGAGAIRDYLRNHPMPSLDGESAKVYVAALMHCELELRQKIEAKRRQGATDEMLSSSLKSLDDLVGALAEKAVQPFAKVKPIREAQFLASEKTEVVAGVEARAIEPWKCFVVIASDRTGEGVVHETRYQNAIAPGISDAGFVPVRNVDGAHPNWFSEMIGHLRTCELAVVDLTDLRPNCIWELGVLHAWDIPVVLIQPRGLLLPLDIFAARVSIFYDNQTEDELATMRRLLKEKITGVMAHPGRGQFLPGERTTNGLGGMRGIQPQRIWSSYERTLLVGLLSETPIRLEKANKLMVQHLLDAGVIEHVPMSSEFPFFPDHQFAVQLTKNGRALANEL